METRILKIHRPQELGRFQMGENGAQDLNRWEVVVPHAGDSDADIKTLQEAARYLRKNDTPVGFPTETVYGIGADATRSAAVKGIYAAKGRPSDNPLIVHVCDLDMLRSLIAPQPRTAGPGANGSINGTHSASIPSIYEPLIRRFWPGPLTILLRNPQPSRLAPEVTSGLSTFGARMPASPLALSLIKLAGTPLAAPSANASTRPSPTTAQHVLHDLRGRIELILDGGACTVGVESTVVDGLCDPPVVLRPGGVSMEELRRCPGWERVEKAYRDRSEVDAAGASPGGGGKAEEAPRAPGMKYKHYSPRAKVVLYEAASRGVTEGFQAAELQQMSGLEKADGSERTVVGIIRTKRWPRFLGLPYKSIATYDHDVAGGENEQGHDGSGTESRSLETHQVEEGELEIVNGRAATVKILDVHLGGETRGIAQGLFSALRELDIRGADIILVEGIEDSEDIAAAVMNRLRKAASEIRA